MFYSFVSSFIETYNPKEKILVFHKNYNNIDKKIHINCIVKNNNGIIEKQIKTPNGKIQKNTKHISKENALKLINNDFFEELFELKKSPNKILSKKELSKKELSKKESSKKESSKKESFKKESSKKESSKKELSKKELSKKKSSKKELSKKELSKKESFNNK